MTFKEIIRLIEEKDTKGWEHLFKQYGQKFYGFAIVNWKFKEDDAWEIVYQTLETVILKIGEYEIESQKHFDNLLFKIYLNFLRQYYRKKRRTEKNFQFVALDNMRDPMAHDEIEMVETDDPFDEEFFQEYYDSEEGVNPKLKELENALNKLDPVDRELLLLKANNFTYDQIAEMLRIENNQLKVKHFRAKQKLLRLLEIKKI